MENLPKLTQADIKSLTYGKSFQRGKEYFEFGYIDNPLLNGSELGATCSGSESRPYRIKIKFDENGIALATCSCPYDLGGICKHLVALLLTYIHKPESIRRLLDIDKTLEQRTKGELISIIKNMIKIHPDLVSAVEFVAETQKATSGKKINVTSLRRHIEEIMQSDWPLEVDRWTGPAMERADQLIDSKDWINAGIIYHALLSEMIDNYDESVREEDREFYLCELIDDMATGLNLCIENGETDKETRKSWLMTLLEGYFKDLEMGGIGLGSSAGEFLLVEANDEEWEWIKESINSKISESGKWARRGLVNYLIERLTLRGKEDEIPNVIEECGTPEQLVSLLIEQGKIVDAVRQMVKIAEDSPGLVTQFAESLIKVNEHNAAVKFVEDMSIAKRAGLYDDWLVKYYRQPGEHGDPQKATAYQLKIFFRYPSIEIYKSLREICEKSKDWPIVRGTALNGLEAGQKRRTDLLIEIALFEDDVEKALRLLSDLDEWQFDRFWPVVAKAAKTKSPKDAMMLYRSAAEHLIERKNRSAYQEAIQHLKEVRSLCETHSVESQDDGWLDWSFYIETLRNKYPTMKAFQEELLKAKL